MNEGVLSFIGVIIGGLIGIVGTLTANYYQNENNRTIYLLDKRREVYLSIIKMYLKINLNYDNAESIEIIDKFQELSPEFFFFVCNFYARKAIFRTWLPVLNSVPIFFSALGYHLSKKTSHL